MNRVVVFAMFLALAATCIPPEADAHNVHPGFLEIIELESGQLDVTWKVPLYKGERLEIDPNAELPAVTGQDPALFESDVPETGMLKLYQDPSDRFLVGLWDCSPMKRVAATIERSELMHILEGSGSITNADGVVFNFRAGGEH